MPGQRTQGGKLLKKLQFSSSLEEFLRLRAQHRNDLNLLEKMGKGFGE
jgi:hypothetical protein